MDSPTISRITMGISPSIQLAPYQYVKPSASVTVDISSQDPVVVEEQLKAAEAQLRLLICRAVAMELSVSNDLLTAMETGIEGLTAFCQQEIERGTRPKEIRKAAGKASAPSTPAVKSGAVRRAVRK